MFEIDTPATTAGERPHDRQPFAALGALLARALDEVDYGVVLLTSTSTVLHLNRRAQQLLDGTLPLTHVGDRLRARDTADAATLDDAVRAAGRGLRRLLSLGTDDDRVLASLVPVDDGIAALLLGRTDVCEELSIQCFARQNALTAAETRVLAALGRGQQPSEIARGQGVKLSTVRTQIGALRDKTGAPSITALVRLVASLPPIVGVLPAAQRAH